MSKKQERRIEQLNAAAMEGDFRVHHVDGTSAINSYESERGEAGVRLRAEVYRHLDDMESVDGQRDAFIRVVFSRLLAIHDELSPDELAGMRVDTLCNLVDAGWLMQAAIGAIRLANNGSPSKLSSTQLATVSRKRLKAIEAGTEGEMKAKLAKDYGVHPDTIANAWRDDELEGDLSELQRTSNSERATKVANIAKKHRLPKSAVLAEFDRLEWSEEQTIAVDRLQEKFTEKIKALWSTVSKSDFDELLDKLMAKYSTSNAYEPIDVGGILLVKLVVAVVKQNQGRPPRKVLR